MRHLKHKTADLIMSHDYNNGPLTLFAGLPDEFESLVSYVSREASFRGHKLRIHFTRGFGQVTISRVCENCGHNKGFPHKEEYEGGTLWHCWERLVNGR